MGQNASVLNGFCNGSRRLLGSSLGGPWGAHESILFPQNIIPVEKHIPCRGTAAVHCITLYESVGNPGHSSRSLRNHISFAMQIVVRNSHLKSSGPNRGHRGVCVATGPHGGPLGPHGGPGPSPGPRQPDSLVSGPCWLQTTAKNRPDGK